MEHNDFYLSVDRYVTMIKGFINKEKDFASGKRILSELGVVDMYRIFDRNEQVSKYVFSNKEFNVRLKLFDKFLRRNLHPDFIEHRTKQLIEDALLYGADKDRVLSVLEIRPYLPTAIDIPAVLTLM